MNYCALTFDDGPSRTTLLVLDRLKKYDICATFFVVGQNIQNENCEILKFCFERGCEIENHSYSHSDMRTFDSKQIREEIEKTSQLIQNITGEKPQFFRPPYIAHNALMHAEVDLPFISGIDAEDWNPEISVEERAARILEKTQNGSIILLHDFYANYGTIAALDLIIPELKKRNFQFVTLRELFEIQKVNPQRPGFIWSQVI